MNIKTICIPGHTGQRLPGIQERIKNIPVFVLFLLTFIVFPWQGQKAYAQACCGETCGADLVVNGSFGPAPCFSNYTTDFNPLPCVPPPPVVNPLEITEGNNAAMHNPNWAGLEHTGTPGSRMLLLKGPNAGLPVKAWYNNYPLEPGKKYCFSFWIRNPYVLAGPPTIVEVRTGGWPGVLRGAAQAIPNGPWTQYCFTLDALNVPEEIAIFVVPQPGPGNDLAIDDITLYRLPLDPGFSFSPNPVPCNTPVTFTSNDQTGSTTHSWTFGDGSNSTDANPTHTYTSSGTYMVIHKADDGCSGRVDTQYITVDCCPQADSSFSWSPDPIICNQPTQFTSADQSAANTHTWKVNGSTVSTSTNMSYVFTGCGTFTVEHTIMNDCDTSVLTRVVTISAPTASFTYNPNPAVCNQAITFTSNDQSSGNTHTWKVNGATVGTGTNLTYTFAASGSYTVEHTIANSCCSAVVSQTVNVTCCPPSVSTFTYSPNPASCNTPITFTSTNQSTGYNHTWRVNGTVVSTGINMTYTFTVCGTYFVQHDVSHPCGTFSSTTQTIDIPAPNSSFGWSPFQIPCGQLITFTATDQTPGLTYAWKVNGISQPGGVTMNYTFPSGGAYTVQLTVSNGCCTVTTTEHITVTCASCNCNICGPNLVYNGNFSLPCYSGYSSDLNYVPCFGSTYLGQSAFSESNNAQYYSTAWEGLDHTPGGGTKFMIIDGPTNSHGPKRAWFQSVSVQAGKTYCFSAWVKNACVVCGPDPTMELRIGGLYGTLIATETPPRGTGPNGWTRMCGTFTATSNQTIELDVNIVSLSFPGNDALLDDIEFGEACAGSFKMKPVAASVYPNPVTKGATLFTMYPSSKTETVTLQVTDVQGRTIIQRTVPVKEGNNLLDVPTDTLEPGIYMIRVTGSGDSFQHKIIVQ